MDQKRKDHWETFMSFCSRADSCVEFEGRKADVRGELQYGTPAVEGMDDRAS